MPALFKRYILLFGVFEHVSAASMTGALVRNRHHP